MFPRPTLPILSLALLGACATTPYATVAPAGPAGQDPAIRDAQAAGWGSGSVDDQAPLYAWDGSPVARAAPGQVQQADGGLDRGFDEAGGSRLVLLELYSQAVEERDEYLLELDSQAKALEEAQARQAELESRLAEQARAAEALAAEKSALEAENQELAGRLATAQIRRLEAEKAWLELAIERERASAPPAAAGGQR